MSEEAAPRRRDEPFWRASPNAHDGRGYSHRNWMRSSMVSIVTRAAIRCAQRHGRSNRMELDEIHEGVSQGLTTRPSLESTAQQGGEPLCESEAWPR